MSGVEAAIGFGASVLGIASAGISVASTLMRFSASYQNSAEKIEDLSSRVSLTATILTTVGNTIENHRDYFKEDDFRGKFGRVTERCKKDYGILGQALSKARSEVVDLASDRERKVRKMTPWRKLIWALGGEERMKDLQSSLEESKTQVLMMQSAASLIVLQILGRRRALTEDETNDLAELKLKMGLLLVALQEAKLLPPVPTKTFKREVRRESTPSEIEPITDEEYEDLVKKKNADQVPVQRKRAISRPTVAVDGSQAGERLERERVIVEDNPERERTNIPLRSSLLLADRKTADKNEPDGAVSARGFFYEAWAIHRHAKLPPKLRTIHVLGIKIKIKDHNPADLDSCSGIAATQTEIKDLLSQLNSSSRSREQPLSTLQQLTALTSQTASTISHLISARIKATKLYPGSRTWAIELLIPWSSITKAALNKLETTPTLDNKINNLLNVGYLLILRSSEPEFGAQPTVEDQLMVPGRDDNPFQGELAIAARRRRSPGEPSPGVMLERYARSQHNIVDEGISSAQRAHRPLPSPSPSPPQDSPRSWTPPPVRAPPIHQEVITHHRHIDHGREEEWPRERQTRQRTVGYGGVENEEEKIQAQKNAETAVNDFLASFSTLYDGVAPEERTKVLDSVPVAKLGEESDSESEEDEEYVSHHKIGNRQRSSSRSFGDI